MNPRSINDNAYEPLFTETYLPEEEAELFNLSMPDERLQKMLIDSLDKSIDYWKQKPWNLEETDKQNTNFLLGNQHNAAQFVMTQQSGNYDDNRMIASVRAILSYATGSLAKPEITPSRSDGEYIKMARAIQNALYQHSADEKVDQKTRSAVMNLLVRKRGYMKLRYDPNAGMYGDVVTEVCNPEDIIIDRFAGFMSNPNIIYHRIRCTVDELIAKFPKKANDIRIAYSIKQGRFSQMSRYITYFEAWFTYMDQKNIPREGVCWFVPEHNLILDKMPNPNWIYTGNDEKDKQTNVLTHAPKPFIWFNYLNMGHSFIDETCLFEQARPQQELLNERLKQFNKNVDFMNGRWIYSKKALGDEDAARFVNKGSRTLLGVNAEDVRTAVNVMTPEAMPAQVYESIQDARNEIDGLMGTPSVFKGAQPASQDTLGRDLMVKQQAGMLQDDLVRAVNIGMESYYQIKLQMMRVYYTEDYWFQVKGGDGKFDFVMLNGDQIDSNVKIGVQVDSTLPLDKASIRATSMELWQSGEAIDYETFMRDLGLPDPEIRAERYLRSKIDPIGYLNSVTEGIDNNDAEVDIMLLTAGKDPQERDDYDADYLNYFNHYITLNKFRMLPIEAQQRITAFLEEVQGRAQRTAQLGGAQVLDEAGITTAPITPPMPAKQIRYQAQLTPEETAQTLGMQPPAQATPSSPSAPPVQTAPPVVK